MPNSANKAKTVLISSIQPVDGGVPQMLRFVIACLQQRGYKIRIAYYEPYSISPALSVPLHGLFGALFSVLQGEAKRPQSRQGEFEGLPATGIGCWIPEFEFTNYWNSSRWQDEIAQCDYHLAVSGSNLAALPYQQNKLPFMAWIATPWQEDREHRVSQFPWYRRMLDTMLVKPVCQLLERRINHDTQTSRARVVSLSPYTHEAFFGAQTAPQALDVLRMPVELERFAVMSPKPGAPHKQTHKLAFVGRFEDPRKNIQLLINAFALCVENYRVESHHAEQGLDLELHLIGDKASAATLALIAKLGLQDHVKVTEYIANNDLPQMLQTLSLFVVPSYQEGLCIAALEAMSCAVPVISTRCGGPESYLRHGENGFIVDANASSMAQQILQALADPDELQQVSQQARRTIEEQFSVPAAQELFWQNFTQVYPESTNDAQ